MSVSERSIHFGVLAAAVLACGWVFGTQRATAPAGDPPARTRPAASEPSLLAVIPAGSALVLTADVKALQRAPLGGLVTQGLSRVRGTAALAGVCGFDPLTRLDRLAISVPSAELAAQEHPEDFGIVAQGRFTAEEIMRCARAVIAQRGGEALETRLGPFRTLRDRKTSGEFAARDGWLIVSGGSYFRDLLDAAQGHAMHASSENQARDARHAELRRSLGPGTIVATWLLGERWFERVAGEDGNARLSPLASLRALGAHIDVSDDARVRIILDCADEAGAARVAGLLAELRASLHALPLDPALSSLAERLRVSQSGARLSLGVDPSAAELSALVGLLLGP